MPYNADISELVWESSNTDVADVENGIITAHTPGETIITAKTTDGELSTSYSLTVVDNIIQKVSANNNTISVSLKNILDTNYDSVTLVVGVYDQNESLCDIKTVPINDFISGYINDNIQVPFDSIAADSHIKVFLWKSLSDLTPLCDFREIIVSESF